MSDSILSSQDAIKKFSLEEFRRIFNYQLEEDISVISFKMGEYPITLLDVNEIKQNMKGDELWTIKDVFKMNFCIIHSKLCEYFPNINISIDFDCSGRIDELLFGTNATNDLDVKITFEKENLKYECAFDFIDNISDIDLDLNINLELNMDPDTNTNTNTNTKIDLDKSKIIKNLIQMDYYYRYEYGYENFKNFVEKSLYKILIIGCSISDDEYKLAKILFIKNFSNDEFFNKKYNIFKKMINSKKNKLFDLGEWYEKLNIYKDGIRMTWYEFIRICQNCLNLKGIRIRLDFEQKKVKFSIFEKILSVFDDSIVENDIIHHYRLVYCESMELLMESLKYILELSKENNKRINYIPQYIQNYMSNDIYKYSYDNETLDNLAKELKKKNKKNKK